MGTLQKSMRATYKPTVKHPGVPGVLTLTEQKFTFIPNDPRAPSNMKLDVNFKNIKTHKFSKETAAQALLNLMQDPAIKGGGFIFEFVNFEERNVCRDLVAKILAKYQQTTPQQAPPDNRDVLLNVEDMECRMQILRKNSDLQKLHYELVMGKVLTEAEFWAGRQHLIEEELSKNKKQMTGLKSAMLADMHSTDGSQSNSVKFDLTPEIIYQIFAEKPAVRQAYLKNVPQKMSDVDFWTKYCRAEYFYRSKTLAAAKAEADDDEQLAEFLKDDEILADETSRKIRKVDPTVDMASDLADDYTHLPGHGILRDPGREYIDEDANQPKRTFLKDINRHAAVVLEGQTLSESDFGDTRSVAQGLVRVNKGKANTVDKLSDERRKNRVHEMTKIEDLQGPQTLSFASLCIKDPRQYFDSQQANGMYAQGEKRDFRTAEHFNLDETYDSLANAVSRIGENGLKDPIMNPQLAVKVLDNLTHYISSTQPHKGKNAEKDVLSSLPIIEQNALKEQWKTIQELLRMFWACYPITSTFLSNKVGKLKDTMAQIYEKLQSTKASAKPESRHQISLLIHPMLQALDAAFAYNEAESQKRSLL